MFKRYLRAAGRIIMGPPVLLFIASMAVLQGLVAGPLFNDYRTLQNFSFYAARKFLGYKVEFNKAASAPVVKDKPVWFVSNHLSFFDFIPLGVLLDGTFAGKGEILQMPGIAQVARVVKFIGLRRSSEYNPESRAKIINNFNEGKNTIMFPEGTTTDGKEVSRFSAGLITLLFGEKGVDKHKKEVVLEKDVIVQPIALRIKKVNGEDAIGKDGLRNLYTMPGTEHILTAIWKQMQVGSTVIEVTILPPLDPKDFKSANDPEVAAKNLINKAAQDIADIVNPGQTVFKKAKIPGKAA